MPTITRPTAIAIVGVAAAILALVAADSSSADVRERRGAERPAPTKARSASSARSTPPARATATRGAGRRATSTATDRRPSARTPPQVARGRASYPWRSRAAYHPYRAYAPYWAAWYAGAYGWGWPHAYAWGWPAYAGYAGYADAVAVTTYDGTDDYVVPAIVELDVRPKRADVIVDGELVGEARDFSGRWDRLDLAPGVRVIELVDDGRQTLRRVVELEPGEWRRIEARLVAGDGVDPRSDAVPESRERHRDDSEGEAAPRARRAALERGLLRLEVSPVDASVYLDGEFLAAAGELSRLHGALALAAGPHRIEIVRPGYRSHEQTIEIEADERVTIDVELRRERAAR